MGTLRADVPHGKSAARLTTTIELPAEITITAAPPETISQRTVLHVCGIPPRAFVELLRSPGFPLLVMRLGKLRLVERAAFVAWLRTQVGQPDAAAANDDAPASGVDMLAAELGLERAAPSRRRSGVR